MSRRDYYNDPAAPAANSLVPAASVVVVDDDGRVLLQRRVDNDKWALPGGAMELGESVEDCARREVREETGLEIELTGIVGIYSDPAHLMAYDDGEVRQEFSLCFAGRVIGGSIAISHESTDVRFFPRDAIDGLPMERAIRLRLTDYLTSSEPAIR